MPSLTAVFSPVAGAGRAEAVVRRLGDAITLGLLAEGTRLPAESELAERLGVSTVSVREALTVLRARGLVDTRRGRGGGSFARPPGPPDDAQVDTVLAECDPGYLRDYFDMYGTVAAGATALAARRAGPAELDRLRAVLAEVEDAGRDRSLNACGRFHVLVAALSGVPRLVHREIELRAGLGICLWRRLQRDLPHDDEVNSHWALFAAIAEGDGAAAREVHENQLRLALDRLVAIRLER